MGVMITGVVGVTAVFIGTGWVIVQDGKRIIEQPEHSIQPVVKNLHPTATMEIEEFIKDERVTQPLFVLGSRQVGKTTAIIHALINEGYLSSERVIYPYDKKKCLVYVNLNHRNVETVHKEMYKAFSASAYLSGMSFYKVGLLFFSLKNDRGTFLDTTMTLLSEASQTGDKKILLWISDARKMNNLFNNVGVKTIIEVGDYLEGLAMMNYYDNRVRVVVQRNQDSLDDDFKKILQNRIQNDCLTNAIWEKFRGILTTHSGEWHAVVTHARELKTSIQTPSEESCKKLADKIYSRLVNEGHNVIIRTIHDERLKGNPSFLRDIERWLLLLSRCDDVKGFEISREKLFEDVALLELLNHGVVAYHDNFEDTVGRLVFEKPSVRFAVANRRNEAR
jgi:hypothetical protein